MKRTPADVVLSEGREDASTVAMSLVLRVVRRGRGGGFSVLIEGDGEARRDRPVRVEKTRRISKERQSMMRDTRAGPECQDRASVPNVSTTRCVVMRRSGGKVRRYHTGVSSKMRMKRLVSAGRVVAEVAVR